MAVGKSFDLKNQNLTQKLGKTFGLFKKTSFIVTILNREFNSTCQEKNHSLFHMIYIKQRNFSEKKCAIPGEKRDENPSDITSKSHIA